MVQHLLFALFPLGVAFGAATDVVSMTIPNRLVLALLAGFVLLAPVVGMDLETFALHLAAGAIVLAVSFACFAFGWIGGGDAKLATAAALWLGAESLLAYLVYAALFGGGLTLLLLQLRMMPLPASWQARPWIARLHGRQTGVPYGVALAAAALVVLPGTPWMAAL